MELHKQVARERRCILAAMSLGNNDNVPNQINIRAPFNVPVRYTYVSHNNITKRVQGLFKSAPNTVPLATVPSHIAYISLPTKQWLG